jgi:putative endonuclease
VSQPSPQKVYCLALDMSQHNEIGKIGEDLARSYLEKEGYKIIEQNYRTKYAEIDLVAQKSAGFLGKKTLVFVEVRTKIGENFGTPEDTLNRGKLWKVLKNAQTYSAFKKWDGPCRIDAVCIVLKPLRPGSGQDDFSVLRLTHHENIIA